MSIFSKIKISFIVNISSLILCSSLIVSCNKEYKESLPLICNIESVKCFNQDISVTIRTTRGNIKAELYGSSAPVTVGNFLELITSGFYEGNEFHRVIKEPKPFIIQAGKNNKLIEINPYDNDSANKKFLKNFDQIRFIPLEIKVKQEKLPRYNEILINMRDIADLEARHAKGSIGMARSQGLDSASSQFYIALKDLPELDGRYAVFGKVIKGMSIIESIEKGDIILQIIIDKKY